MVVGVLALQGSFNEHIAVLRRLGVKGVEIKKPEQLRSVRALIIPGGESTTMAKLAEYHNLVCSLFLSLSRYKGKKGKFPALREFVKLGNPVWGTCAGLIFLADKAIGQKAGGQDLIGGLNCTVHRNFFGSQVAFSSVLHATNWIQSFEAELSVPEIVAKEGGPPSFRGVFIRAPGILEVGPEVQVLAEVLLPSDKPAKDDATSESLEENAKAEKKVIVAVKQGTLLATAFHPELTADTRWHSYFLKMLDENSEEASSSTVTVVPSGNLSLPEPPTEELARNSSVSGSIIYQGSTCFYTASELHHHTNAVNHKIMAQPKIGTKTKWQLTKMRSGTVPALVFLLLAAAASLCSAIDVTYDGRALVIDGKRRVLVSGSIHYPRSTPDMWPDLIQKSKEGGLDIIETYVFWDFHEPVQGKYDFSGPKDLVKFIKLVGEAGLYVHLRIGPYVCAEWNYGGFPMWLHSIPGIQFRTDNEPYKVEMQKFTVKIVDLMKQNNLYATQGGPIILSQIENEYGNIDWEYGAAGKSYINWAAQMATSTNTGVPWVMCQQSNAPDPMINSCNGFYCDQFSPNSGGKPKFWTELWSGWFSSWGDPVPYRPVQDVAFAAARFYQLNGTLYHGGTNFGRTSGGPFISTSYDYDAPLDEQPKWGHLKDLHLSIKLCEEAMVSTSGVTTTLGASAEATVYESEGKCAAFLANWGDKSEAVVQFRGNTYHLPAWSVSILPDCKNVVFNTAQVNAQTGITSFVPQISDDAGSWSWFKEPVGISNTASIQSSGLVEQINTTADKTDFLWYSLTMDLTDNDPLLQGGSHLTLHVDSKGHALHAFINGNLVGNAQGKISNRGYSADIPITLQKGNNIIDLLSMTVGLQNYGSFYDVIPAGITGVYLKGLTNGLSLDLSSLTWKNQIGLGGEQDTVFKGTYPLFVSDPAFPTNSPLTWYKTTFSAPPGTSPVAIDFTGMGKGNHVPRSMLKPSGNVLVMLEEIGGDPTKISFTTREVGHFCARVAESHPAPPEMWGTINPTTPTLVLQCPNPKQIISQFHFVSFGTPQGNCGTFSKSQCHSETALGIVQKECIGRSRCSVEVSVTNFGDPCAEVTKSLAVEASCS
ncbi:beta-galactosidase 8 [Perilla frutescens var. hirtella]|uniref:Beta-galactosidase n=1 Tax=Perilla frutescens var. hirtella TaxID=608512 RepID=A0AAD4J6B4_PERFH|nr:beta-galactosidase 8 [Perilla frutescens var. hirtella]